MAEYRFLTTWCLDAPIQSVFEAIDDAASWPQWWKGVRRADLIEPGDEHGLGRLWRFTWRSRLPYDLSFESRVTRRDRHIFSRATLTGSWSVSAVGACFTARARRSSMSGTCARRVRG